MRVPLTPAFILHTRAFRETSLLVEAFTPGHGRLGLVARGARRPRSSLAGAMRAFRPVQIAWSGRGELATLTRAEAEGPGWYFTGAVLASGMYLNELLYRLLPRNDPAPALFGQYAAAVEALAAGGPPEPVLRLFEKQLLDTLGYALMLDCDAVSGLPLEPTTLYRYEPESGPQPAAGGGTGVDIHGASLLALAEGRLEGEQVLREIKHLMRAVLALHLGGRPLRSRELLRPRSGR